MLWRRRAWCVQQIRRRPWNSWAARESVQSRATRSDVTFNDGATTVTQRICDAKNLLVEQPTLLDFFSQRIILRLSLPARF